MHRTIALFAGLGSQLSACEAPSDSAEAPLGISAPTWTRDDEIGSVVWVQWDQQGTGSAHVEVELAGEPNRSTPEREAGPGENRLVLLGIPYGTPFTFRLVVDGAEGSVESAAQEAQTGDLPAGLPLPSVVRVSGDEWDTSAPFLLGSVDDSTRGWNPGTFWTWILDRQGRVVWALPTPDSHWTLAPQVAADGTSMLVDEATWWSDLDTGAASVVHRMRLDGDVLETIATPGLHHDFTELDDGTLIWGAADWFEENLLARAGDGTVATLWSCRDWLNSLGESRACQTNGVSWDPVRDTLLVSIFTLNTVVELDRESAVALHHWGQVTGSPEVEPAFAWQHSARWTGAGTLLLSTYADEADDELVAREYAVDGESQALRQVWSFGEGQGVHADTGGDVLRLPGGNTLHSCGSSGVLRELSPNGEIAWEVTWEPGHLLGRTTPLADLYALGP